MSGTTLAPTTGQLFAGRYRLEKLLRSTPLAHVYAAHDMAGNRAVQLTIGRAEPAHGLKRRESQRLLAAAIQSAAQAPAIPGVAPVWDHGHDVTNRDELADGVGVQWMAGAPVPGVTIDRYPRPREVSDFEWALLVLCVAARLAGTLIRLHDAGAVHGGLGPASVLIHGHTPAEVTVQLVDLGPGPRQLQAKDGAAESKLWRHWGGASIYAAPEIETGTKPSPRSDVYGFGLVLAALLSSVQIREPGWDELLHPETTVDVALELRRVAEQAMQEKPSHRQYSFHVVAEQLDAIRTGLVADLAAPGTGLGELDAVISSEPPAEFVAVVAWVSARIPAAFLMWIPGWKGLVARTGIPERMSRARKRAPQRAAGFAAYWAHRAHRRQRTAALLLAAAFLVVAAVGAAALRHEPRIGAAKASPATVQVPIEAGRSAADAITDLKSAGLTVAGQSTRHDDIVGAGIVLATTPAGGTQISRGGRVQLIVSTGPAGTPGPSSAAVPELTGGSQTQAAAALAKAGLKVGMVSKRNGTAHAGTVLASDPAGNTATAPGSSVDLVVASGQQAIPAGLVGYGIQQVTATLTAAGFTVTVVNHETSRYETGYVLHVDPASGSPAAVGSAVTITVAHYASPATSTPTPTHTPTPAPSSTPRPSSTSSAPPESGAGQQP